MGGKNIERIPIRTITVGNDLPETRRRFFKLLDSTVRIYSYEENYLRVCLEIFGEKMLMAFSVFELMETRGGRSLRETGIHVNKSDFLVGGEDYTDLIPLVVFHEKVELWNAAGKGMYAPWEYPEADEYDELSHRRSLLAEYTRAIKRGQGERHIRFMQKFVWSQPPSPDGTDFLKENLMAYEMAKKRFDPKNGL